MFIGVRSGLMSGLGSGKMWLGVVIESSGLVRHLARRIQEHVTQEGEGLQVNNGFAADNIKGLRFRTTHACRGRGGAAHEGLVRGVGWWVEWGEDVGGERRLFAFLLNAAF